jgi:hypothetical protein
LPSLGWVNPRPEIVLPPGFALRIDYDPAASPASLLITAYRDETPVGQAHVDPREVGLRLRLELADGPEVADAPEPRLRLTPSRAMRAIMMSAVQEPVPPREVVTLPAEPAVESQAALAALQELARDGALGAAEASCDDEDQRPLNALVWLENGSALVLPSVEPRPEQAALSPLKRALRTLAGAAELLAGPLRLRDA